MSNSADTELPEFRAFIFDAFYMHLYHIYMMHFIQPIDEIKIKFKNM